MFKFLLHPILPFLIISICGAQRATPFLGETTKIGKEPIVTTGKTKSEMFQAARSWTKKKYPDCLKMIQVYDVAGGQIVFKTSADVPYGRFKSMNFTVTVISGKESISALSTSYS